MTSSTLARGKRSPPKARRLILLPIWGGDETLAKARAIENRIFLVTAGYDHPTYIMNPDGERISVAGLRGRAAVATIEPEPPLSPAISWRHERKANEGASHRCRHSESRRRR